MAKFSPPSPLDFTAPEKWPEWRQRFQQYRTATKLKDEEGDVQVNTLIYSMGPEAETVLNTFKFNADADKTNFDIVVKLYDDYFAPRKNVIHERAMFYTRNQKQGETAELFRRQPWRKFGVPSVEWTLTQENRSRAVIKGAVSVITNMRDDLALRKENSVVSVGN